MWSQRTTLALIEDLHGTPCLWDVQCAEYKNKTAKSDALEVLARKYQVTAVEMEKKIQALKNQFRREHKKLVSTHSSGSSPKKSIWFGYEHLLFLLQGYVSRRSRSADSVDYIEKDPFGDLREENDTDGNLEEYSENETSCESGAIELASNEPASSENTTNTFKTNDFLFPSKPKKKRTDDANAAETFRCAKSSTEIVTERDEYTVYGEHIANKLRNSGRSRFEIAIAQHEIDDICFKLNMGAFYQMAQSFAQSSSSSRSTAISPPPSKS